MHDCECPFCARLESGDVLCGSALSAALLDGFPIGPGHCLIVPRRHVGLFFDLTEEEQRDLFALVPAVKKLIEERWKPDAYNVGLNVGEAAGQTVPHVHLHVIPRYRGDVPDPRGGIRWVIPGRARYWEPDPE